jgi:hypothetical protein
MTSKISMLLPKKGSLYYTDCSSRYVTASLLVTSGLEETYISVRIARRTIINHDGKDVTNKALMSKLREKGFPPRVWKHTLDTFDQILC